MIPTTISASSPEGVFPGHVDIIAICMLFFRDHLPVEEEMLEEIAGQRI